MDFKKIRKAIENLAGRKAKETRESRDNSKGLGIALKMGKEYGRTRRLTNFPKEDKEYYARSISLWHFPGNTFFKHHVAASIGAANEYFKHGFFDEAKLQLREAEKDAERIKDPYTKKIMFKAISKSAGAYAKKEAEKGYIKNAYKTLKLAERLAKKVA